MGAGEDGKRRQTRRRGFRTKKAAQEALDKLRGSVTTQSYVVPAKQTLGEYLAGWLAGLPTQGLRPSTVDGYRRNVLYIPSSLARKRLDQVTASDLDQLYSDLLASDLLASDLLASGLRRRQGGLSPRSVRYLHVVVSKALSEAVRKGELARNVATVASPPRAKSTKAPEAKWWPPAELRAFLDFTADETFGPLFRLAAMTGMRRGEVCGLAWDHVDLDRGRLDVRQQLLVVRGGPEGGLLFSATTKTDRSRRTVDLDPATVAVLRSHRARQAEQRLALGPAGATSGAWCSPVLTARRWTLSRWPRCSTGGWPGPGSRASVSMTSVTPTSPI